MIEFPTVKVKTEWNQFIGMWMTTFDVPLSGVNKPEAEEWGLAMRDVVVRSLALENEKRNARLGAKVTVDPEPEGPALQGDGK